MAEALKSFLGRPSDWGLRKPDPHLSQPHRGWIGPILIGLSLVISWPAFVGARGEHGNVSLGLYVGAVSIMLMAWSFVLAVRFRFLEPIFGGLDAMYRVHRWVGALAVVFMFWHVRVEPEIENGIRGASKSIADQAEDLAGTGELMLYILVALSLVRLVPYRYWRWTHKLLGLPFLFASAHFFTAEKPYANNSGWGWWFSGFMIAGTLAYLYRVVWRDVVAPGLGYRVASVSHLGTTITLELEPHGAKLEFSPGQFAFVKIDYLGLREPHCFTFASSPDRDNLRFVIRELGDWTGKLRHADLEGVGASVEGPYSLFEPFGRANQPVVWVAGGVGITPFLSAIEQNRRFVEPPTVFYAVRSTTENPMLTELEQAEAAGNIRLRTFSSADGQRLTPVALEHAVGPDGLTGTHVALCGPTGLVSAMAAAAGELGATSIERADFDLRGGIGPERSLVIDDVLVEGRARLFANKSSG